MMLSRLACQSARLALAAVCLSSLTPPANAQQTVTATRHTPRVWPLTRPELTNYAETSRYDDVVSLHEGDVSRLAEDTPLDIRVHLRGEADAAGGDRGA